MLYKGSCHCGDVAYEVEGDLKDVMECNCSICARKGSLLWFVPRDALKLKTPEQNLSTYTFNKHVIRHHFCAKCGMHPFAEASDKSGKPMAAINARCIENVDFSKLNVKHFDGKAL